jgi:hypothetical protein
MTMTADALVVLRDQLDRFEATGDEQVLNNPLLVRIAADLLPELHRVNGPTVAVGADREVLRAVGLLYWWRYLVDRQREDDLARALAVFEYQATTDPESIPSEVLDELVHRSDQPDPSPTELDDVVELLQRGLQRGDRGVLDQAIARLRSGVAVRDGEKPPMQALVLLGDTLNSRYAMSGSLSDLRESVGLLRRAGALGAATSGHPIHHECSLALSSPLLSTFGVSQNVDVLDEALALVRRVEQVMPRGRPERPFVLQTLGVALFTRLIALGTTGVEDIDRVIAPLREAVETIPAGTPQHWQVVTALGVALVTRAATNGDVDDADEACALLGDALRGTPAGHMFRVLLVPAYAKALLQRGDPKDLDLAVAELDRDEPLFVGTPAYPDVLQTFARALLVRSTYSGSRADADHAVAVATKAVALPTSNEVRAAALDLCGCALAQRYTLSSYRTDLDQALDLLRQASALAVRPNVTRQAVYAQVLRMRFEATGDLGDLDTAVDQLRRLDGGNDPSADEARTVLALTLALRAQHRGVIADARHALDLLARSAYTPAGAAVHAIATGTALLAAYQLEGDPAELDGAVRELERNETQPAPTQNENFRLANLGYALYTRFELTGVRGDLDDALAALRTADSRLGDSSAAVTVRCHLGAALTHASKANNDPALREEAIPLLRDALSRPEVTATARFIALGNLGTLLREQFTDSARPADLAEAIDALFEALRLAAPGSVNRSAVLCNLSAALVIRFEQHGAIADVDEAVRLSRAAVAAPGYEGLRLSALGVALLARYEAFARDEDLEEAIVILRDAAAAAPAEQHARGVIITNLSAALFHRFCQQGTVADLDEAIALSRSIVEGDDPDPMATASLAYLIEARFDRLGHVSDLEESVRLFRAALAMSPPHHRNRAVLLSGLGGIFRTKFSQFGDQSDMDEALEALRAAVEATGVDAGHIDQGMCRSNLGVALLASFEHTRRQADLEEAITRFREAVELTMPERHSQSLFLSHLGVALSHRYDSSRDKEDLRAARAAHRRAVEQARPDDPRRATYLTNLAKVLMEQAIRHDDPAPLTAARDYSREAARLTAARIDARLNGTVGWSSASERLDDWSDVERALACGVDLLAPLAWRGLDRTSQERQLGQWTGLGLHAAAAALVNGDAKAAVELLERSRSVLWTGLLDTHSPLGDLAERDAPLVDRLIRVRSELNRDHPATTPQIIRRPTT